MTPFEDYVFDSERQNVFNHSQPKDKLKFITVYVEGIEDKSFWFHILSPHIKTLEFRCFSNDSLRTGKKGLREHCNKTGKWLIVCLDSDYDYLFQKLEITQYNGIFQTYTYSIENLKCYSESLIGVCADVTYNPTKKISFVSFLEKYSKTIYSLFIWHLYFYSLSNEDTVTKFYEIIQIPSKFNINAIIDNDIFKTLKKKVDLKIDELEKKFSQHITKVNDFSKQLKIVGLEDKNTYLFIQGHTLYDNVVLPLLRVVCDNLKVDSIKEINKSSAKLEHKDKVRYDYLKSIGNSSKQDLKEDRIKLVLLLNKDFKNCFLFKKIDDDIQAYLKILKTSRTHV